MYVYVNVLRKHAEQVGKLCADYFKIIPVNKVAYFSH